MKSEHFDLRDAILSLNDDEKKELDELHKSLMEEFASSKDNGKLIYNESLIKKTSAFCLYLIERTHKNKESMQKTAYIISGFNRYNFSNPELNDATEIAEKLQEGWDKVDGSFFDMWDRMEYHFQKV